MTRALRAFPRCRAATSSPMRRRARCSRGLPAADARMIRQRRRHRRHLRRGLPHEGDAPRHHRRHDRPGRAHAAVSDDRLRHLGDRLRLRGRHRARAGAGRDAGRPARRRRPALRRVGRASWPEAGARARRPVRADLPGTAVLRRARPAASRCRSARHLRYFGDGWQIAKGIGGMRYWRVPVMDGEFVCEETTPADQGRSAAATCCMLGARHATARWRRRSAPLPRCSTCPT